MIDRISIKQRAKEYLKISYIKNVVVGIILMISLYALYTSGGGSAAEQTADDPNLHGVSTTVLMLVLGLLCIGGVIGLLIRYFVLKPVEIGCRKYFLNTYYAEQPLSTVISSFSTSYLNEVKILFFRDLFLALWSCLFIIPGIIKSYSYRMIPYILAENPGISMQEAFDISKRMMDGRKLDTFVYDLSFIGWYILSCITCNLVGIFYFYPYKALADAQLYITFKNGQGNM